MVGVWATAPSIPSARKGLTGSGNRLGGRAIGGIDSSLITSGSTFVYDGTTWSTSASLITPRAYHAGGDDVVFGGESPSGKLNSTEKFNGTSWESSGAMLQPRSYHMGYGSSSNAFAAGGSGTSGILSSAEWFNGSTWSAGPSLAQPREMGAACGTMCLGGFNGTDVLKSTEVYNGTSWSSGPNMLVARMSLAAGGTLNNAIAFGGSDLSGNFYADTEVCTGDAFTAEASLLMGRAELGGDGTSTSGISIGGARAYGCLEAVEVYYIDNRAYPVDFLTQKRFSKGYTSGLFLSYAEKDIAPYRMSISKLVKYEAEYGVSVKIRILPGTRPVVSTFVKTLAYQVADIHTRLATLDLSHKIDYSTGSDLDNRWGKLYNLKRFAGENDVQYRKRLKTYVLSQVGSGTMETCKKVLDEVVGKVGSTEISIYEPGKIYVRWKYVDAIRFAMENQFLVEYALQRTLAAGIDWQVYFGIADYWMGYGSAGSGECLFRIRTGIRSTCAHEYYADLVAVYTRQHAYTLNASMWNIISRGYSFDSILKFILRNEYLLDVVIAVTRMKDVVADILLSYPNMRYMYPVDGIVQRTINRAINMRGYVSVSWIREMWMWTRFEKCVESSCNFGVTLV